MNIIFALAGVVIMELYRRKDFYVLFILTAVITLMMGSVNFFNEAGIVRIVKDIAMLLIWASALVIAISTTARQIPAEREQRTIFPLLAKPVTRAQVIVGKFLGCWLACGIALVVFYLFFAIVSGAREHQWLLGPYLKAFWLQWSFCGIVVGLVLVGSVLFTAPSSNATICFVIVLGILLLGGHLNKVALQMAEPLRTVVYSIYFVIPHLEWYDVRELIVNERLMPSFLDCGLATLYAAVYTSFLLFAAWILFRRKALTL
jgi:ABC-type transport system involved in multi-copper enzyme maturation permease subunit